MQHYRKSAHSTYDIKCHILWITKYRKSVITGNITNEVIADYIRNQDLAENIKKDNFEIFEI